MKRAGISAVQWYQAGNSAFVQTAVGAYGIIGSGRLCRVEWTGERSCDLPWVFRAEGHRGRHLTLAELVLPCPVGEAVLSFPL